MVTPTAELRPHPPTARSRGARQAFAAGVIDELVLDIAPVLLGEGEALFRGVADPGLEPVDVIHSPKATHITYRIGR